MQAAQCSCAEFRAIAAAQVGAHLKGVFRHCRLKPQAISSVVLQGAEDGIRLGLRNLAIKNLVGDRMGTFRRVKRGKPDAGFLFHPLHRGCGMPVPHVERCEETRIGVGSQKRPRSFIKSSTAVKTRSPNIFLARASKSGHFAGFPSVFSGTMRAMTRSRSRSSTVFPALSQAFRRRVSRSWRRFTDGIVTL